MVRKLIADVRANSTGVNYLIQHSAGSGKSNSIAWTAYRLASLHDEMNRPVFASVVIVTDRTVLDRQLQDTISSVLESVRLVANRYPEGSSAVLAFSLGATLCLYLFLELKQRGFPYTLPSRWLLNSPFLRIPPSKEEQQYMDLLAPHDVTIPKEFLLPEGLMGQVFAEASPSILRFADISRCNLGGMPETDLYVGTREIALACVEAFEKNCETAGIKLHVHEGLGMMHCWGLYAEMKEGRKLQKEYFDIFRTLSRIQ